MDLPPPAYVKAIPDCFFQGCESSSRVVEIERTFDTFDVDPFAMCDGHQSAIAFFKIVSRRRVWWELSVPLTSSTSIPSHFPSTSAAWMRNSLQ